MDNRMYWFKSDDRRLARLAKDDDGKYVIVEKCPFESPFLYMLEDDGMLDAWCKSRMLLPNCDIPSPTGLSFMDDFWISSEPGTLYHEVSIKTTGRFPALDKARTEITDCYFRGEDNCLWVRCTEKANVLGTLLSLQLADFLDIGTSDIEMKRKGKSLYIEQRLPLDFSNNVGIIPFSDVFSYTEKDEKMFTGITAKARGMFVLDTLMMNSGRDLSDIFVVFSTDTFEFLDLWSVTNWGFVFNLWNSPVCQACPETLVRRNKYGVTQYGFKDFWSHIYTSAYMDKLYKLRSIGFKFSNPDSFCFEDKLVYSATVALRAMLDYLLL